MGGVYTELLNRILSRFAFEPGARDGCNGPQLSATCGPATWQQRSDGANFAVLSASAGGAAAASAMAVSARSSTIASTGSAPGASTPGMNFK